MSNNNSNSNSNSNNPHTPVNVVWITAAIVCFIFAYLLFQKCNRPGWDWDRGYYPKSRESYDSRQYKSMSGLNSFNWGFDKNFQRVDNTQDPFEIESLERDLEKVSALSNTEKPPLREQFTGGVPTPEGLPPFQVKNSTYWPSYYYAYPYNENTYAWPPGMFSRLYNWYPGFSSGTGLTYYKRDSSKDSPRPRDAWIRKTQSNNPNYFVSNRGEYQFNESNYRGIPSYV